MPNFFLMFSLPKQLTVSEYLIVKRLFNQASWNTIDTILFISSTDEEYCPKVLLKPLNGPWWNSDLFICINANITLFCIVFFFQVGRFKWAHNSKRKSAGTKILCSMLICFHFFLYCYNLNMFVRFVAFSMLVQCNDLNQTKYYRENSRSKKSYLS